MAIIDLTAMWMSGSSEWGGLDQRTIDWWERENNTDFATLKSGLPGPPAIHRDPHDNADAAILQGRKKPVLILRRVICVWTPPHKS